MSNEDLIPILQGTWRSFEDPYWGYLKFDEYKSISEGGECVAIVHARHGRNEPPIWYRGVWKPTARGFEALAGPYHWKHIFVASAPGTQEHPAVCVFRSKLNGWGECYLHKLDDQQEQEFVDSLKNLPVWQQVKSFWADYPSATWPESKKWMQPYHHFNGPPASQLENNQYPENQWTHNGGQTMTPQGGGQQPAGAGEQPPSPANDSDGPGMGPDQTNTPQNQENPPPESNRPSPDDGGKK